MARTRQSKQDSGLGVEVYVLQNFEVRSWLGSSQRTPILNLELSSKIKSPETIHHEIENLRGNSSRVRAQITHWK